MIDRLTDEDVMKMSFDELLFHYAVIYMKVNMTLIR